MSKEQYLKDLFNKFNLGAISEEAYDAGVANVVLFCEDKEVSNES